MRQVRLNFVEVLLYAIVRSESGCHGPFNIIFSMRRSALRLLSTCRTFSALYLYAESLLRLLLSNVRTKLKIRVLYLERFNGGFVLSLYFPSNSRPKVTALTK